MKAILHYRAGPSLRYRLAESPPEGWIVDVIDETDADLFARSLPEADVLLHVLRPISRAQMELAPRLKLIQKIGVGVDTIDLEAAEELGIGVANMPGTNSQAVAELAIGLMLAVLRQVPALDRETRAGRGWSLPPSSSNAPAKSPGAPSVSSVSARFRAAWRRCWLPSEPG